MKHIYKLFLLFAFLPACRKSNKNDAKDSAPCLQTTFLATNISEGLQSVFFLNGKDGFVTGSDGGIYKTTDSAKSWILLHSTVQVPVRDIFFVDSSTGFAVGGSNSCGGSGCTPYGGFILRTVNGGQTWENIFIPSKKIEISSLYFVSKTSGFCAGDNMILKTTDGGATWNEYEISSLGTKMMKISFTDPQNGFVICAFDKIIRTKNGGSTWEITSRNKTTGYYYLSASNGSIYISGQGKVIKSVNGGNTWNELVNSPSDIYAIHFINRDRGFGFGRGNYSGGDWGTYYEAIYCTNDGGISWNGSRDIKEIGPILAVSFPTDKIGYATSGNKICRVTVQ